MRSSELAYLAGVVDALGSLRAREVASGSRLAQLTISSPLVELVGRCAQLTGVGVTTVRRSYDRVGCREHCDEPHLHVVSITARWQLVGARAVIVLDELLPYLVIRHEEAAQLLSRCRDAPIKSATVEKMRALGWEVAS